MERSKRRETSARGGLGSSSRRAIVALAAGLVVLATPLSAAASAYSPLTYLASWYPPSYSHGSLCGQAAMIDTAQNYNQAVSMYYRAGACNGGNQGVPSGYLGSWVEGYRDGVYCGATSVYYSTTFTSAWQLWATLCSNPSGSQTFQSFGESYGWTGSSYLNGGVWSPAQNY
jgi:hypothetical protein